MSWNHERIALTKQLWAAGESARGIAARLGGVTRSAVLGKLHRLGLSDTTVRKKGRPTRVQRAHRGKLKIAIWGGPHEPFMPLPEPVIPPSERKHILDLTETCCRYPIGDPKNDPEFGFCGRGKFAGLSYCEAHAHIAYRSPQSRAEERQRTVERKRERVKMAA